MRIAVVSDTHGHVEQTRPAIHMVRALDTECVLHCGDVGGLEVVQLFDGWPTHFVEGNCDHATRLQNAVEAAGQTFHGEFGDLELAGVRIALLHSHDQRRFREACQGDTYSLVCYGHTHVAEHHYEGETLVLNPGALYRARPHSIAIVDLPALTVETIVV